MSLLSHPFSFTCFQDELADAIGFCFTIVLMVYC